MGFQTGKSESRQSSQQQQNVWQDQVPFLQSLYSTASSEISRLLGQDSQYEAPALEAWRNMLGGGGTNPALAARIKDAQGMAAEGFAENILPAIQGAAIDTGSLGGSRGGIAAGMAGREAVREQSRIAEGMTYQDYNAQQQRILQALNLTGGLNSLSQSSLNPLLALAQILGRPTTLSSGSSSGRADSWNVGVSMTGNA